MGASTVSGSVSGPIIRRSLSVVSVVLCAFALAACAGGIKPGHFASVDPAITGSIITGSVPPADREESSDETTIRNAVSSANLEELGNESLAWANLDTGSRGAVTDIHEYREGETLCRKFRVSRESFEGIALYRGDACLMDGGKWTMRDFSAI